MGNSCITIIHNRRDKGNMEKGEKKINKTLTLKEKVVEIGEKKAAEDNRTLSNYVETLILRDNE